MLAGMSERTNSAQVRVLYRVGLAGLVVVYIQTLSALVNVVNLTRSITTSETNLWGRL